LTEEKLKKFIKNLKKKHMTLRKWAEQEGIEAYRVYNQDMGDLPLAIDIYGKYLHITLFESKSGTSLTSEEVRLLVESAGKNLYFPENRIFFKTRTVLSDKKQYDKFTSKNVNEEITEFGHRFKVNLSDYIDTGLFLDHRVTRQMVEAGAAGKKVLNLFCYTGSFSVYAAAGGAESTTSVDLSNVYLQWAKENMALNLFVSSAHKYVQADVFSFLKEAEKSGEKWDLIILDPPTFSNSRKMEKVLDIQKDHLDLINSCLSLLIKNGKLIFSNNYGKFRLDPEVRRQGFVNNITEETIPEDFKGSKIHKCWLIEKRR
jgi:23S rRNA G2069 N7-methylase RlmK/C1962 C5-methylase RlmI